MTFGLLIWNSTNWANESDSDGEEQGTSETLWSKLQLSQNQGCSYSERHLPVFWDPPLRVKIKAREYHSLNLKNIHIRPNSSIYYKIVVKIQKLLFSTKQTSLATVLIDMQYSIYAYLGRTSWNLPNLKRILGFGKPVKLWENKYIIAYLKYTQALKKLQ